MEAPFKPGQLVRANLAGMQVEKVTFHAAVTDAVGNIIKQTSEDPPRYLVRLLFSFRGINEVEVPADRIRGGLRSPDYRQGRPKFCETTERTKGLCCSLISPRHRSVNEQIPVQLRLVSVLDRRARSFGATILLLDRSAMLPVPMPWQLSLSPQLPLCRPEPPFSLLSRP